MNSDSSGPMCSDALVQALNATFCLSEELKELRFQDSGSIFVGFKAVNRRR